MRLRTTREPGPHADPSSVEYFWLKVAPLDIHQSPYCKRGRMRVVGLNSAPKACAAPTPMSTAPQSTCNDMPEDIETSDRYIAVPHKNAFDLGRYLVTRFVRQAPPDCEKEVDAIFRRRGAYRRFKDFLDARAQLKQWYEFETGGAGASLASMVRRQRH